MEINIVEELIKLRANLLSAINNNPLPVSVKILVVDELAAALRPNAAAELNSVKKSMAKEEKRCQTNTAT